MKNYDEEIYKLSDEMDKALDEGLKNIPIGDSDWYSEFTRIRKPYLSKIGKLSREKRMKMEYTLDRDIPEYGDRMTLEHFIECVKCGGFIDYDGSGTYIKDGKMTNITILPSDVKHKAIRKEFKEIIWFNK